jgi:hypothetical protein
MVVLPKLMNNFYQNPQVTFFVCVQRNKQADSKIHVEIQGTLK